MKSVELMVSEALFWVPSSCPLGPMVPALSSQLRMVVAASSPTRTVLRWLRTVIFSR